MDNVDKKMKFLDDLKKLDRQPVKSDSYTSMLDQDVVKIPGATEKISTVTKIPGQGKNIVDNAASSVMKGSDWTEKIAKLRALNKIGKNIPGVGALAGIAQGLMTGDANATIPILNEADGLGASEDSLEGQLERGNINMEEFLRRMNEKR